MAGTVIADNLQAASTSTLVIKNGVANTPPTIQDSAGTQIGTFCRAWVNFNGSGTVAIRSSFNVSSITDNAVGYYTVNFTNALPDANYTAVVGAASTSNTTNAWVFTSPSQAIVTPTTSAFTVITNNITNSSQIDATYITVAVFR
jgi:hypothetical protein